MNGPKKDTNAEKETLQNNIKNDTDTSETNQYYAEHFPTPMKKGKTDEGVRTEYYNKLLEAGKKMLKEFFYDATDVCGKGRSDYPKEHAFRQKFSPKEFSKQTSYNRMWQAIQLASQVEFLKQITQEPEPIIKHSELENLKITEQWKLIDKPNDNDKVEKVAKILNLSEKARGGKGTVTRIAERWTPKDIINALESRNFHHLTDFNMLNQVIGESTDQDKKTILKAIEDAEDYVRKNILRPLKFLRDGL